MEQELEFIRMQRLLQAMKLSWLERDENGSYRCSRWLSDRLQLTAESFTADDFLLLIREDFREAVSTSKLFTDDQQAVKPIDFPMLTAAGECWLQCTFVGVEHGRVLFSIQELPQDQPHNRKHNVPDTTGDRILQQRDRLSKLLLAFLETKDLKRICEDLLTELLTRFNANRVYIIEMDFEKSCHNCLYEVVSSGTTATIDMLQEVAFTETPWWTAQILEKCPIILNTLDEIPPEGEKEKAFLSIQQIQSLMITPMLSTESVKGYIGVDIVDHSRKWSEQDYQEFAFITNIISICIGLYDTRQEAEKKSHFYQELHEHMPLGFMQYQILYTSQGEVEDYVCLGMNRMAEQLTGLAADTIIGKKASEFIFPELLEITVDLIQEAIRTQRFYHERKRYIERTQVHCTEIDYMPRHDELIVLLKDDTDTVNAHETAFQHEHLFWNLFQKLPVGVELYNAEGYLMSVNPKDCEIFGAEEKNLIGVNIFENPIVPEWVKEHMRQQQTVDLRLDYRFERLKGYYPSSLSQTKQQKDINAKITPLYDNKNRLEYYLVLVIDSTDTVNIRNRIHDFENIFSLIADFAKVGYGKYNPDTHEGYAMAQWFRNLGDVDSNIHDIRHSLRYLHATDRKKILSFIDMGRKHSEVSLCREVRVKGPMDKKWRWLRMDMIVNHLNNGTIEIIAVNIDITQSKEERQNLIEAKKKAEKMDRLKSAFLANMSHEIRTPLNAIVGFSQLLVTMNPTEESERNQYMQIIRDNNDVLLQLISDILDLSKIEAGVFEFNYSDVSANGLCHDLALSLKMKMQCGVELIFDDPGCDYFLFSDKTRIMQVLVNFVTNAAKFTSQGGVHIGLVPQKNRLKFYVRDTGTGIPKEQLERIFERFVKLNTFIQGTGLGLSICKSLIEQLGGSVGVESKPGKGSCFWFKLPYKLKKKKDKI